jgi:scyllo-inositol 2-dehydrogenase (NADP+)
MKQFKTALMSYGSSGRIFHGPLINAHPGFILTGALERSKKNLNRNFPNAKSYDKIDDLLEAQPDLVILNTPNHTHYEYGKKLLSAGMNLVVEKAFTVSSDEARELKALAEERGVMLSVFHNRRWDSDFLTVRNIFNQNVLGELIDAEFRFDRFNPVVGLKKHKESPGPGAGILYDIGPHLIDQAISLFGAPYAVFGDLRITREASQVNDDFDLILFYKKLRVRLKAGFFSKEALPAYALHGTRGSFVKYRADMQEKDLSSGRNPTDKGWGTEPEERSGVLNIDDEKQQYRKNILSEKGNYLMFYDGIYKALVNGSAPPVTAADGLTCIRIIEAALKSNAKKTVIELK